MDSVSFAGHITFAILAEGRPSMSLIAPAFLACILFVQEAQLFALANQIQHSETFVPPTTVAPAPPQPAATPSAAVFPLIGGRTLDSPTPPPSVPPSRPTPRATPSTPVFPRTGGRTLNSSIPPPATSSSPFANLVQIIPNSAPTPARPSLINRPTRAATPAPTTVATGSNTATADPSPAISFGRFLIHHIRTDPQAQLWIGLFIFLAVIVQVILSPVLSVLFVATTYSSIWMPQIIRSARRNRTSGLSREYVVGVTGCRLASATYFLTCPQNVLEVEPRSWAPLLAFLVIFQAVVLMLQDTIGPSFFLPEKFKAPKGYDYHPPMPLPDSESPEQSLGDCAICMDMILLDPFLRATRKPESGDGSEEKGGSGSGVGGGGLQKTRTGLFSAMQGVGHSKARKNYSLAPCHHLFHTECLEKWLVIKNICPQCRRPLPPL